MDTPVRKRSPEEGSVAASVEESPSRHLPLKKQISHDYYSHANAANTSGGSPKWASPTPATIAASSARPVSAVELEKEEELNMEPIERFRKEAIWSSLNDYKRKLNDLNAQYQSLLAEKQTLTLQSAQYKPVLDLLRKEIAWSLLTIHGDSSNLDELPSTAMEKDYPDSMLALLSMYITKLHDVINLVKTGSNRESLNSKADSRSMREQSITDQVENEKRIIELIGESSKLNAENTSLKLENENLKDKYYEVMKRAEKWKLEKTKLTSENAMLKESLSIEPPFANGILSKPLGSAASEGLETGRLKDLESQLESMTAELQATMSLSDSRLLEIESLRKENSALAEKIDSIKAKYSGFPSDFIPFRDYYEETKHLKSENGALLVQTERLVREVDELHGRLKREHAASLEVQEDTRKSLEKELESLREANISIKMEKESTALLNESLATKMNGLAALNKEYQTLLESQKVESKLLKDETERLQSRVSEIHVALAAKHLGEEIHSLIRSLKQDESTLMGEIEAIAQAYEASQTHNGQLIKQLASKEDNYMRLYSEKLKLEQSYAAVQKEKETLSQAAQKSAKPPMPSELVIKLERKLGTSHAQLLSLEKELANRSNASDYWKRKANENAHIYCEIQEKSENLTQRLSEHGKELEEKRKELNEQTFEIKRLREELEKTKSKLDSFYKTGSVSDKALMEELSSYKQLLKCNTCQLRHKEVALNKCMHVFCRECIDKRLETRQRKCPTCSEPFSASDVRTIFL